MDRNLVNANSDPIFRVDADTDPDWHPNAVSTPRVHMLINQIFLFPFCHSFSSLHVLSFLSVSKVS
jgi:hypothetical protein